jgi:hypothetical protein
MSLAGRGERLLDADVELLRANVEPDPAALAKRLGSPPKNERASASQPGGAAIWTWSTPTKPIRVQKLQNAHEPLCR